MIDFNVKDYVRSVLPTGQYTFRIVNAELKPTKSNPNCKFLNVSLEVVSEFRKGSRIFDNFNIYHEKETVRNIGRSQLADLCSAIDLPELKDIKELIGFIVAANVSEDSYNGAPVNRVDKYIEASGSKDIDIQSPDDKFNDEIPF